MPNAVLDKGKKTFPSLSTSLGVKGSLRVRPYGNVKHAHIVLRKVDEEDYVDSKGITRRRAIFSLFAQKLINVKPGKELYLYLHTANSDGKDTPIAFEGDLTGPDEELESRGEEDSKAHVQEVKKEVKETEVREQAMPPKMRKAWLRKQESAVPAQVASPPPPPTPIIKPVLSRVSVGTQTIHESTSVYVQTTPQISMSSSAQTTSTVYNHFSTQTIDKTADKTADKATRKRRGAPAKPSNVTRKQPQRRTRFAKEVINRPPSIDLSSETGDVDDFKSRSLSPMELESPATTPSASPRVDEGKVPQPTNEIRNSRSLSPLYSPRSYSPITLSEIDNPLAQAPVEPLNTASTAAQVLQTNIEVDNNSISATQTRPKGVDSPSTTKTKTIPVSGVFESAYDEIQALLNKKDTKESKGDLATKKPLPGFVKAAVPYSQAKLESATPDPTQHPDVIQSGPKIDQAATTVPKSRGFISSFVPISSDSFTTRSRVNLTKRPEPPQKSQSDIMLTSSNGHAINTSQYSPLSPSINAIASSSKVTVERFVRHSSFNNYPPTTVPIMRPPPPPITTPVSTPIMSFLPPPSSTSTGHPSPVSTPVSKFPLASTSPQTPIPIPVSHVSPTRSASSSHILRPQSTHSTPLLNGNSRTPSEVAASAESSNIVKIKEEVFSPTLLPLSLPDDISYDPTSSSFDTSLPENGFDMLPVSVVHASDPSYVQDDVEYGPPKPVAQPQYDLNGIKSEPIDIPLLFNDFNFANFPKNTNDYTNYKSDPYNYSSPAHTSLPPKPYFPPQNDGSLKRRHVESIDSDDDNSNRRNLFRRVYTSQIRFDFGAGIREILFNHMGSHFAVICYDHTIRIWNNRAKIEIAKLAHNASVITASWVRDGMGVISLGMNGVVNRWTCSAQNQWHWSQLLDTGDVEPTAMDYRSDRVAVAFPRVGVRIWVLINGYWQQQRMIRTVHVLAVKFIGRGDTLLSACADGRLWRGNVRDGVKEVCHVTRTKIFGLDIDPSGRSAVVTEAGGKAHVLAISPQGQKFTVNNMFGTKDIESRRRVIHPFGALFASHNNLVVFGSVGDRIFVWERNENSMISELDHGDNILVQAVANLDEDNGMSCLLTGNKEGRLVWWTAPADLFDNIMAEPLWKRPRVDY